MKGLNTGSCERILVLLIFCTVFKGLAARNPEDIKRSGVIRVAFTADALGNINHDLALEFARYMNVEMKAVEIRWDEAFMHNGSIPGDLESDAGISYTPDALNKADIICSTFTVNEWRKKLFGFAETLPSAEILVVRSGEAIPEDFNSLSGKRIAYMRATTFELHLLNINTTLDQPMDLVPTLDTDESERLFEQNEVSGVVLDADEALAFIAGSKGEYTMAFPISEITQTAWAVEKNSPLVREVENFFKTITSSGVLDEIFLRSFGMTYTSYLERLNKTPVKKRYERDLAGILASRKLVVALRERDFVYHEGGQKQFMHALAEEFADYLGVSLEFVVVPEFSQYWETEEGLIVRDSSYTPELFKYFDLACETFAPLDWRTNKVNMVPVYPSTYTVVARKDLHLNSVDDLQSFRGVTDVETVYEEILKAHRIDNYYYENINNFLPDVAEGRADYAIIYNAFLELSDYPELEVKFELGALDVCWALRKDQPDLQEELENFLSRSREQGLISSLLEALKGNSYHSPEAFLSSYYESFQTGQLPYLEYGAAEGLPQEDVFSIFQDRRYYMWFGTSSGAVRYNGRAMQVFDRKQGMPADLVMDIKQDSSGVMYFATSNGIAKLEDRYTVHTLLEGVSFSKIFIDSRDHRWYLADDGIYHENPDGVIRYLNADFPDLPEVVYDFEEDPLTGDLFIATNRGIYCYDEEADRVIRLSEEECYTLYFDASENIWISEASGLRIIHRDDLSGEGSFMRHGDSRMMHGSPVSPVKAITTNRSGSVWLVSESEILQYFSNEQDPIVYRQGREIKNNEILSFLIDREDNIWIGYAGGLQRITNRRELREFYPDILDSRISSIFQDPLGRLWINSNSGTYIFRDEGLKRFAPPLTGSDPRFAATSLANGNILLANSRGMYEVNSRTLEIVRSNRFSQPLLKIESVFVTGQGEIFLLTGINGIIYHFPGFDSRPALLKSRFTSNVFQLIEYGGRVVGGNNAGFVTFNGRDFELLQETDCHIWSLYPAGDSLWVGSSCGLGLVRDSLYAEMELYPSGNGMVITSILPARNRNYFWLGTNRGFGYYHLNHRELEFTINSRDGLSGDEITPGGLFLDRNGLLWVGSYHGLSNFNIKARSNLNIAPACYIGQVILNGKPVQAESGHSFSHDENNLMFEITALLFSDESALEYEYYLRGTRNHFASYYRGQEYRASYTNLPPGRYEFIYKARGNNNIWAYAEKFEFSIHKAWYFTWLFRVMVLLLLPLGTYVFYLARNRAVRNNTRRLEQQVRDRTHELVEANREVESRQKAITDSISYARRIQSVVLPAKADFSDFVSDHFILFQPRDQVSGDFYWFREMEDSIAIVDADCTGHGIPGAFMSMLGVTLLNEELGKYNHSRPGEVMDVLRQKVKEMLDQKGELKDQKDGMEMAFILLDKEREQLQFAGANFPLYLVRKKDPEGTDEMDRFLSMENGDYQLFEIRGDRQPIGYHWEERPFTNHVLRIRAGDTIYIFSDGILDQYGGAERKRYKAVNFKKLLLSIQEEPMEQQKISILSAHCAWRGFHEQIDDISVIGVRI